MADLYKIGIDHDQTLGSLTTFPIQPRCEGLQYTRETFLASGIYREGPFFYLLWNVLGTPTRYQAVLALCGLSSLDSCEVTILGPDRDYNFVRYNATVVRPIVGQGVARNNYKIRDVAILFRDLEAL